jgi:hypothetical protein
MCTPRICLVSPCEHRLLGRLYVLLAMQHELHAIGASPTRMEQNRREIARIRGQLARAA